MRRSDKQLSWLAKGEIRLILNKDTELFDLIFVSSDGEYTQDLKIEGQYGWDPDTESLKIPCVMEVSEDDRVTSS